MIELKEVSCSFSDGFGGKGLFTAVSPPQTGESFSILWVILAAVAAVGAVLFCGKKLVRAK